MNLQTLMLTKNPLRSILDNGRACPFSIRPPASAGGLFLLGLTHIQLMTDRSRLIDSVSVGGFTIWRGSVLQFGRFSYIGLRVSVVQSLLGTLMSLPNIVALYMTGL